VCLKYTLQPLRRLVILHFHHPTSGHKIAGVPAYSSLPYFLNNEQGLRPQKKKHLPLKIPCGQIATQGWEDSFNDGGKY
jgi:hypothetical protein